MVHSKMNRLINYENRVKMLSILNEAEHIYTTVQKTEVSNMKCFEESLLCYPKLHLFDQKYSRNSNTVKYFRIFCSTF